MTDKQWEKGFDFKFKGRVNLSRTLNIAKEEKAIIDDARVFMKSTISQEVKKERERIVDEMETCLPKVEPVDDKDCVEVRWRKIGNNLAVSEIGDILKEIRKDFPKE